MPHQKSRWWSRLGRLFARHRVTPDRQEAAPPGTAQPQPADEPAKAPQLVARRARGNQTAHDLQETHARLLKLTDSLQSHMDTQQARTEQLVESARQLVSTMQDLPVVAREQAQLLGSISSQLETVNATTGQLADTLAELPASAQRQGQTLEAINQRLELANQMQERLSSSLNELRGALEGLGQLCQQQGQTLKEVTAAAQRRDQQLEQLLRLQSRRTLLVLLIVAIILAVILAAAGTIALYPKLPP